MNSVRSANSDLPNRSRALVFGVVCFAAIGFALISQHRWDMQPCPWCIAQRMVFLLAGTIAFIAAWFPARARPIMLLPAFLCASGVAMAVYQHWVAQYQTSCSYSIAEKWIRATGLDQLLPWLFDITATCADAATAMLGVIPYAVASGALLLLLFVTALFAFKKSRSAS
jgi:protein dithiol:quinone oxidoreductase